MKKRLTSFEKPAAALLPARIYEGVAAGFYGGQLQLTARL
jgi:hypothetical protein